MVTIRVPTFRRLARAAHAVDTTQTVSDAQAEPLCADPSGMRFVWLCVIVGAALSVGIAAGAGLDHAGVTEGATSWMVGVIAFWASLVPLMVGWAIMQVGKQ